MVHEKGIGCCESMFPKLKARTKVKDVKWKNYEDWKKVLYDYIGFWLLIHVIESSNRVRKTVQVRNVTEFCEQVIILI
jgi:hypothetical protein